MIAFLIAGMAGFAGGLLVGSLASRKMKEYYESQIRKYEDLIEKTKEILDKQQQNINQMKEEIARLQQDKLRLLMNWISSEKEASRIIYIHLIETGEFENINQLIILKFKIKFLSEILSKIEKNLEIPSEYMDLIEKLSSQIPQEKIIGEKELLEKFDEKEVFNEFYKAMYDKITLINRKIQTLKEEKIEKEIEMRSLKTKEKVEGLTDKEKSKLEDLEKEIKIISAELDNYESIYAQNRNFMALAAAMVYYKEDQYVKKASDIIKKFFKSQYLTNEDKETLNLIGQIYLPKVKKYFEKGGEEGELALL